MKVFILITLMVAGLVGCGGSSNKNDDPLPPTNVLQTLSSQDANSEASIIDDAAQLKSDINALFNAIDPVEVETGDNIQDVINRAEGS